MTFSHFHSGPRVLLIFDCGAGGNSATAQTQSSDTNQVGSDGEGNLTVGNSTLGNINVTDLGPDVAAAAMALARAVGEAAIEAATGLNETAADLGADALDAATQLNSTASNLGATALETAYDLANASNETAQSLGAQSQAAALALAQSGLAAAESQVNFAFQTVQAITDSSNQIASGVAKSQEQFVATATGQTSAAKIIGIAAAVAVGLALLPALLKPSKS